MITQVELGTVSFKSKMDEVIKNFCQYWPIYDLPFEVATDEEDKEVKEEDKKTDGHDNRCVLPLTVTTCPEESKFYDEHNNHLGHDSYDDVDGRVEQRLLPPLRLPGAAAVAVAQAAVRLLTHVEKSEERTTPDYLVDIAIRLPSWQKCDRISASSF